MKKPTAAQRKEANQNLAEASIRQSAKALEPKPAAPSTHVLSRDPSPYTPRCCHCGNTHEDHYGHEFGIAVPESKHKAATALIEHLLAMADDAYLTGHPEWNALIKEARTGTPAEHDGPTGPEDRPHRGTDVENG